MLHEINLHANRIALVACGGAAVINLPGWIYALNHLTKDIELEVVLTHSAERLVSKNALTTVLEKTPYTDADLFSHEGKVLHRHLAEWPDFIIVAPLTLNTLSKSALLIADTLATSILTMTSAPVYAALSFPERLNQNPTLTEYREKLQKQKWMMFNQREALALATKTTEKSGMMDFYNLLLQISNCRSTQAI